MKRWCEATLAYWAQRKFAHNYFWFHQLFAKCYHADTAFATAWDQVPKWSANEPHAIQRVGPFESDVASVCERIDWQCPVFKLTDRLDNRLCVRGTLLARLLGPAPGAITGTNDGQ